MTIEQHSEEQPHAASRATTTGGVVASLWVLLLFSNLPLYVATVLAPEISQLSVILLLLFLAALVIGTGRRVTPGVSVTFLVALLGYASMCLVWYLAGGGGDTTIVRQRLLGLIVCGVSCAVFSYTQEAFDAARRATVVVVLCSIAINFWDITHPFAMLPIYSEFATVGRAAGLYMNPNQSGAALVLGFALSVAAVPRRWRAPYTILVAVGVALTLSRAAMLGMVLVCLGLSVWSKVLTAKSLLASLLTMVLIGVLGWALISAELQARFNIDPALVSDRVLWILDPEGRSDFSQEERIGLLERGWSQFMAAPFVGNGVGSTELWEARSSTHNVYAMLASDFGVVGLFVLPAIIFAALGSTRGSRREFTVAGCFILFWGLFSHNVLGEFYMLIGIGMIAASRRCADNVGESLARIRRETDNPARGARVISQSPRLE